MPFRIILSDLAKYSMTPSIARSLCDSWAPCIYRGWSDLDKISQTTAEWHVELQYGGRLGEFNAISSQSHVSYCRVLPLGEFTVMIPEPHATLQGTVTWRNQCHDYVTLQGVTIPSAILKIVFCHIFCINAVWAVTSSGFRIVSDTLV